MESGSAQIERLPADFMHHPYEMYERLRAEGPAREVVMPHGVKVWMVTRYADVRSLLADARISKDGRRMNEMFARHSGVELEEEEETEGAGFDDDLSAHMLNSDPPRHSRLRKLVGKAFTAHRMEGLRPRITQVVDELLDGIADKGEADLIESFATPLPITIISDLLGVPIEDREIFRMWATTLVGSGHDPEEVAEASGKVIEYSNGLIEAKRVNPGEDMLSALVQVSEDGDALTRSELVAMIFLLVVAGHETTMHTLGNAVHSLLTHPDQLETLRANPALMPGAADELMRYDGGVGVATFRFTKEDIALDGVTIPAGEVVVLSLGSANRDGAKFEDPDRLDITRHPLGNLAFGHGIHYCIGAPLAKLEVEIGLGRLINRFPDMRLAAEPQQLRWKNSNLMKGLVTLPVRV